MKRIWLLLFGAAAIVAGLGWMVRRSSPAPAVPVPAKIAPRLAGQDFAAALSDTDKAIAALDARIATGRGDMIDQEGLAGLYQSRFALTGRYEDLVSARDAADRGFAISPKGMGPWLARAHIAYAAHRLADTAAALDRVDAFVVPQAMTVAEARAMRGDLALSRGDYAQAERDYAKATETDTWPGLAYRQALLARFTGRLDEADALFTKGDALNRDPSPRFRSDTLLRRGEIALIRGDWPRASALFAQADRTFPGFWRNEMRVAQMQALSGDMAGAVARFEAIAMRTNAPEAMDIAAGLHRALGQRGDANIWAAKGSAEWTHRSALLPEAAAAHRAEHELAFGDPKLALALAGRNAKNRPYGEPLLLLAKTWVANGRADYALALAQKVEASGWRSLDLWRVRAEALTLLGRGDESEAARNAALAFNPHAFDRNPALGWLDH